MSCSCPNPCVGFENLPSDHGLMITLNIPHNNDIDVNDNVSSTADGNYKNDDNITTNSNATGNVKECTCLKLHPQLDANLSQFHPNIYIPESLLDYPDRLVKYGGGGELYIDLMDNCRNTYCSDCWLLLDMFSAKHHFGP